MRNIVIKFLWWFWLPVRVVLVLPAFLLAVVFSIGSPSSAIRLCEDVKGWVLLEDEE